MNLLTHDPVVRTATNKSSGFLYVLYASENTFGLEAFESSV